MALILTEEQEMLRESVRGFLDDKAPVAALRKLRDEDNQTGFDRDLWREMAQMGWAGILIGEDHGGVDFGYAGVGVIAQEMGRSLTASPFLSTAILSATAIVKHGSKAQQDELLPLIASGELVMAMAVDEGQKHRPSTINLRAEKSGNGYQLKGSKAFVADGFAADKMIVAARTSGEEREKEGITLFLVDGNADQLERERTVMVDSRGAARLAFNGVDVDGDDIIGEVDGGYPLLEGILNAGRAGLSSEMSGAAQQAFEMTMEHISTQKWSL